FNAARAATAQQDLIPGRLVAVYELVQRDGPVQDVCHPQARALLRAPQIACGLADQSDCDLHRDGIPRQPLCGCHVPHPLLLCLRWAGAPYPPPVGPACFQASPDAALTCAAYVRIAVFLCNLRYHRQVDLRADGADQEREAEMAVQLLL